MTKNKENFIKEHCKWYSECINCEMCSKVDEVNPNKCYEEYKKIKYFDNDNDDFYYCHDDENDMHECLKYDNCKACPFYYSDIDEDDLK